jgi:predicted cupin superfamily sugar epimerase
MVTGQEVAELLGLEPLPGEGGMFRRTHIDAHSSAIYYLLVTPDFSALHTLTATETYHWYAGSPVRLLLLGPGGGVDEPVLGPDLAAGERPQIVVPAGTWQGSTSAGKWTLVGTTTAPPFDWAGFRLGDRAELLDVWPAAATRIGELTTPAAGSARTGRRTDR